MSQAHRKPRYLALADRLIAAIQRGEFEVGELLPTELELCAEFGLSRHTAREALRLLEQMGLIERRRGAGTRVIARQAPVAYRQTVQTIDDLLQYGATTRLEVLRAEAAVAAGPLAARLGLAEMVPLAHLLGLRRSRAGGPPIAHTEVWLPRPRGRLGERLLDPAEAAYALMELLNVRNLGRVEQLIEAEALDAERAARLAAPAGSPALRFTRRYFGTERKAARACREQPSCRALQLSDRADPLGAARTAGAGRRSCRGPPRCAAAGRR
ncbi:MAG: GntR family transcriptional regulator [Xanthomonadales bacterium]|nr:GntR family transcriptional regulator [Xanthomonadales bacterium]